MTFQRETLNSIFGEENTENLSMFRNLINTKSDQTLSNQDFASFIQNVKKCMDREYNRKWLKHLFDSEISMQINNSQMENICKLIKKHTTFPHRIEKNLFQKIQEIVVEVDTELNQANVKFYKFILSQWLEGLGLPPTNEMTKDLLSCEPLKSFYNKLHIYKRREYSSYAAQLSKTLENYFDDVTYLRWYFHENNNFLNNSWKSFLKPYQIISIHDIADVDLKNYYAQIKLEGERLLVSRSKCSPNIFKCKIPVNEGDPCNWVFFDKNFKFYSNKKYEECPITTTLDYIFFPIICAAYSFQFKHYYEKDIGKQLKKNSKKLENFVKLYNNKDGDLFHFVYNLKIKYTEEMESLEKKLVDQYLNYMMPVVCGHVQEEGELLIHQGYAEGIYGIFPTFNCKRRRVNKPFAHNGNEVLCDFMCTEPCIVLDCTMGYVSSLIYETNSESKGENMMRQVKPYISKIKEYEKVTYNVIIVHDIYSIGNHCLNNFTFEKKDLFLTAFLRMSLSDRVTKPKTINLSESEFPRTALKDFMQQSLMYASSGIILRHKSNNELVFSLKTKCCVDLICLALTISNFDIQAVYLGVQLLPSDKFDSSIVCILSERSNNLPIDLKEILFRMYEQQKTVAKLRCEKIVIPNYFEKPNEYFYSKDRLILEIEGILNNTNSTGLIIEDAKFKRVRYDRKVSTANTLKDLYNIQENIKFMNSA